MAVDSPRMVGNDSITCSFIHVQYIFLSLNFFYLDSLDVDLYGDLLAVDLNQEMTYPEVKTKGLFCILNLYVISKLTLQ